MEPSGRNQQEQDYRFPPTVTRDKWRSHILTKLNRGYVLIVSSEKRIANFFMRGKGYESCAFDVARQLVNSGLLVKAFDHHLGTAYTLAEPLELTPPPPPSRIDLDDEDDVLDVDGDMNDLLDELAESNPEDDEDEDENDEDEDHEVEEIYEDEDDLDDED